MLAALVRTHAATRPMAVLLHRAYTTQAATKLRVLKSTVVDPVINLSTEEHIFRSMNPSVQTLFLWRNQSTVVIGRNQNPWKECNVEKMQDDGVVLARRTSGGGAVYQDLGNTNFTFLSPRNEYCVERNVKIITNALAEFGIEASASGRNDIVVDGRKISGSAYKITHDRAFHHGTILVNVDMSKLTGILNPSKDKLKSKGVASVKARVLNLCEMAPTLEHDVLCDAITKHFFAEYGNTCDVEQIDGATVEKWGDVATIRKRLADKAWTWGVGQVNSQFNHKLDHRFDWGSVDIDLSCKDGKVEAAQVFSDTLLPDMVDFLRAQLDGAEYTHDGMRAALAVPAGDDGEAPAWAPHVKELEEWLIKAM